MLGKKRKNQGRMLGLALLLCAIMLMVSTQYVGVYGAEQSITFLNVPTNYDPKTGSFLLGYELFRYHSANVDDTVVCLSYDYFIFSAQSGQVLAGQLRSYNQPVSSLILNSQALYNLQSSNCGAGYWEQAYTASTINWTAPASGEYAFIIMANRYYEGPVYFIQ